MKKNFKEELKIRAAYNHKHFGMSETASQIDCGNFGYEQGLKDAIEALRSTARFEAMNFLKKKFEVKND